MLVSGQRGQFLGWRGLAALNKPTESCSIWPLITKLFRDADINHVQSKFVV
jgi:hypothetical protein